MSEAHKAKTRIYRIVVEGTLDEDWSDWLGGSRYGGGRWMYAREQRFIEKTGVPFYCDAVGWPGSNRAEIECFDEHGVPRWPARQFHHLNWVAWDVTQIMAIYRPERFSCYTTKYGSMATDPYCQFAPFDGRFTTTAQQWLTVLQFLREAERGGILIPKPV